ncbi:hypothetical protein [Caballeronia sp. 15715]|uniref:hypothetical protein n=1 Tax=unclassified Caballeronia TaxID=2646786 RepID=UPI0039E6043E
MKTLLETAVEAHGGLQRWKQFKMLNAHASIGGGIWALKGKPEVFSDTHIDVDLRRQHVEYSPFGEAGQHSVYEPTGTAIVKDDGRVVEKRDFPRTAFGGHHLMTPWDDHHLIYFSGYAIWTYLTTPFLFTEPGFESEELEPWLENGQEWRRLKVVFPANVASHCEEQTFYFDSKGLLRRHDYSVDVIGGSSSANYATDHKDFGGIVFPTKRRVYARGPDNRPLLDRVAVAIDLHDIKVA